MSNKIHVLNTRNRYYNGARQWAIIEIEASELTQYERVWFVKADAGKVEVKQNIVQTKGPTVKEIKKELDHLGVQYDNKARRDDLLALLEEAKKSLEDTSDDTVDTASLKNSLIEAKIIDPQEAESLDNEAILALAEENGFTQ